MSWNNFLSYFFEEKFPQKTFFLNFKLYCFDLKNIKKYFVLITNNNKDNKNENKIVHTLFIVTVI